MSKIAVIYWSGTGNTEAMADLVANAAAAAGASVDKFTASEFNVSSAGDYTGFALGCPAMGAEQLEESEFEPMYQDLRRRRRDCLRSPWRRSGQCLIFSISIHTGRGSDAPPSLFARPAAFP
ncbi:flavodoxin domain-containing protein [Gemmiger formicilis]|uniref:flavodoxin domain-containing protein n=1 Tax=Gemmiger formicilis TaxID=745368 RepID=UPI003CCB6955